MTRMTAALASPPSRDFHFACPAAKEYTPECPARHLFRIRSNGKAPFLSRGSSAQAKKP